MHSVTLLGFYDEMEKTALRALTRFLMKKAPAARQTALKALPKTLRSQEAYKQLGSRAAAMVKRMPGDAGHGAQHVFNVTRSAQQFTRGAPVSVRRRATMGSLLHDVGREAEGGVKKRIGKGAFKRSPDVWHSELGGRYSKDFLSKNRQAAQYVPGMNRGRLSGTVRAHDTDIHAARPWTRQRLQQDPAAGATYLADKAEGMGRMGAERTVSMAKKFKEPVQTTMGVVGQNMDKYTKVLQQPYVTQQQRQILQPRVTEYQRLMQQYAQRGSLPPAQAAAAPLRKAAHVKESMSASDVIRLLQKDLGAKKGLRALRNLARRSPTIKEDMLTAAYRLPKKNRFTAIQQLGDNMKYILGKSSR